MHKVELIGTCALCFNADTVEISIDDYFETLNSDIWFSALCKEQGVDGWVIPHNSTYIRYLLKQDDETVFKRYRKNDAVQTDAFNRYFR
jgi:hypothetical protein